MLTQRMRDCCQAILAYQAANGGVSPTYDELVVLLGIASKNGAHKLVLSLEERGMIRRVPCRARAIEVLKVPVMTFPSAQYFVVERIANQAVLVPLKRKGPRR